MSARDVTELRRIKELVNQYPLTTSSNYTESRKMCVIENTEHIDEDGDVVAPYYYDVPITVDLQDCTTNYTEEQPPIMYKAPMIQSQPYVKKNPALYPPGIFCPEQCPQTRTSEPLYYISNPFE